MTIPFLDYFKKKPLKEQATAPRPAPVEKAESDRLSKTVMPNATRTLGGPELVPTAPSPSPLAAAPSAPIPRTVSFSGNGSSGRPGDLPPAVALALAPRVERAISLELSDVLSRMPAGLVRALENGDASRRVLLKAAELERGMAIGKPTVSIVTIHDQVPEIFLRKIEPSDTSQVELPFDKVLAQFNQLQVRDDQSRPPIVPHVETPFLQVTLEDDAKFGTTTEMPETSDLPPVRVEPATAEAIAAAEPEALAREKYTPLPAHPPGSKAMPYPISTEPSFQKNGNGNGRIPRAADQAAPSRIPFDLSPKGTGAPATERVPASSGPSVPTSAPTRIPFKMTAPSDDLRPKMEPWVTKENFEALASSVEAAPPAPAVETNNAVKIVLALKPILQSLPPLQLAGDISGVPDDAKFQLPFSLVEPQLASGRILLDPAEFARNLPEEYRALFNAEETTVSVVLPLQEVLKNLPATSLRMRDDQVEQEKGANFATPFSLKAEEDAKRFKLASTPAATVAPEPEVPASAKKEPEPEPAEEPNAEEGKPKERSILQVEFDTDDELDAKSVVAYVDKMSGVKACAFMFGDGLSLAGTLPTEYQADGLCAMAPSVLKRIENHMVESNLGGLQAMTLSCAKAAITFFMDGNLCLAALHASEELIPETRERLARVVHELSRKYSHSL
jgi:predicted regulator of Ras-like GTPase activity (Roadblock/LC7/MglB family)